MFLDGSLINKFFMTLCYAGSFLGFIAGFLAAASAVDPTQGVQVAIIAVVTAMVGLFGGVAIPAWRLWLEYREKMRNDLRGVIDQVAAHLDETQKKVDALLANQEEHKRQHAQQLPPEEAP
jgi:hypothetical protein